MQLQVARADRADPPRAQTVDDHRAVSDGGNAARDRTDRREDQSFAEERGADLRDRESHRGEDAHFGGSLFEPHREEQIREQQCRHDEEEAEVQKVLTEVRRSLRRGGCLIPNETRGESRGNRIERLGVDGGVAWQSQRRHSAVARPPQPLPIFERDNCFRRGAIRVPVVLVLLADTLQIDREWRVPRRHVRGVADARVIGCERRIGALAAHRQNAGNRELRA